jgi:hypothetical protein
VDAGIVTTAANYTAAVRETGRAVRTVVMSMAPAHPLHPSDLDRTPLSLREFIRANREVLEVTR